MKIPGKMQYELEVCNLEWSNEQDRLIHKLGLKRKYDASITEHSLCALFVMLVAVRPDRNKSNSVFNY